MDIYSRYTFFVGRAGVPLAVPRVRFVFSESVKDIQLDHGGPSGPPVLLREGKVFWRLTGPRLLSGFFNTILHGASDVLCIFMPSRCRVCGSASNDYDKVRVCRCCVDKLQPYRETALDPLCTRCGDAIGMESARFSASMGISECTMCRLAPPEFDKAVFFTDYGSEMREMLHLLKFKGKRSIAEHTLGIGMANAVLKLRSDASRYVVVIPVPLFWAKQKERGFNQATLLASAALKHLHRVDPVWELRLREGVLERTKDTRALYALNPAQRRRSLRGAFRVLDRAAIQGQEVLLIDDIMTTGATARECARVLKRAGATRVWIATAAKAQPEEGRIVVQYKAETFAMWDASATAPRGPGRIENSFLQRT